MLTSGCHSSVRKAEPCPHIIGRLSIITINRPASLVHQFFLVASNICQSRYIQPTYNSYSVPESRYSPHFVSQHRPLLHHNLQIRTRVYLRRWEHQQHAIVTTDIASQRHTHRYTPGAELIHQQHRIGKVYLVFISNSSTPSASICHPPQKSIYIINIQHNDKNT